ncbi:uncharacterized protein LOC119733151 [Patiria miniata]|uniref:Ig-like domain-containing protein n=1 Tax=Patiria miniata TaxID=46514 RepID=A0A914AG05_PATMI|nr:uncharacterized protein LOC119733151 [Patiria miniata]
MLLKQQQVQSQPASWRYVYFLLMSVVLLSCIPREVTPLFLIKGSASPASEFINITEGKTLSMNCSASGPELHRVWWGKSIGSEATNWLTQNSIVETNDPRVSIANRSFGEHNAYSLQITDITESDAGRYKCHAEWGGASLFGYIFVSVQYFPAENPFYGTNESDRIPTESVAVWCDTAIGNPGVTITWRVDHSDKEVTCSVYSTELPQNERVRCVVKLGEHLQNQVFLCTVTSSAFPGQNQSCSVSPILLNTPNTSSRALTIVEVCSTQTIPGIFVDGTNTSTGLLPTCAVTSETHTGYIVAAVGIPAAFVVGFLVSLACIRKRQQTVKRRGNDPKGETAAPVEGNQPPDTELSVIPYLVTTMRDDDVTGTRVSDQAYETRIGHGKDTDNAAYQQVDRDIGENEVTSSYLELQ